MPDTSPMRRLAAILASDVVGYSRMMAADEVGTLAALKHHRETIFDPAVAAHNGRIVKLMGDGALVEFGSVVEAVNCAITVQRTIAASDDQPRIAIRIGVNLGDIIIEKDDIYGDGVNIAARLEPLAPPGGVCVSAIVNESVRGRIEASFIDGGEAQVKNIDRPIRIWKWHPDAADAAKAAAKPAEAHPAPPVASIAVLPFTNMSGDAEQEYFSDGISEDIITDLSKVAGLMVIARNSTFVYKGQSVDVRAIGRDLGVSSVLEGSIRRAGNRVRITAQLIDATTGAHVWADRYDRDLTDIFSVQDEVTRQIVSALRVTLTPNERGRLKSERSISPEAHDAVLKARDLLNHGFSRESFDKSVPLLRQAIERDPLYSEAFSALALAHTFDYQNQWESHSTESLATARGYIDTALEIDPDDAYAHYVAGIVYGLKGSSERAIAEFERSLELSPNFAAAINAMGVACIFTDRSAEAVPKIERAIRLDPVGAQQYLHFLGLAHLLLGNYETAAMLFRERIRLVPDTDLTRAFYASTLGYLGQIDEARNVWRDLMRINPLYNLDFHLARLFNATEKQTKFIRDGLARAGLPPPAN